MTPAAPFSISREFKAPLALVFATHTKPEHLEKWLSPEGFTTIHAQMDFIPGGQYHYGMEGPGGIQMWGKQVYREIIPNQKIVYIQSFSDKDGGLTRHPMSATWPLQMLGTTTFEAVDETTTRVTISWQPYEANEIENATFDSARDGMTHGFGGSFAKLEAYLARVQA